MPLCRKISHHISTEACNNSSMYGHKYCSGCSAAKEKIDFENKYDAYKALLNSALIDAIMILKTNRDKINGKLKYWSSRKIKNRYGVKRWRSDLGLCMEMGEEIIDTKIWMLSDAETPGSFVWLCNGLGMSAENIRGKIKELL